MTAVLRAAAAAFSLALPPRCPACGIVTEADARFCADCFGALDLLGPPWCARCGEPFAVGLAPYAECDRCADAPPAYATARAPLRYLEPAKAIVLGLKHGDDIHLAHVCAMQIARVGAPWLVPPAVIVPVPLHPRRLWARGYNQAALIAGALARRAGLPTALDGLVRTRATPPSEGMGREERQANVAGAFAARRPDRYRGRPVILVDDVMTSGATMDACAAALDASGAGPVHALAFARVAREARPAH